MASSVFISVRRFHTTFFEQMIIITTRTGSKYLAKIVYSSLKFAQNRGLYYQMSVILNLLAIVKSVYILV